MNIEIKILFFFKLKETKEEKKRNFYCFVV